MSIYRLIFISRLEEKKANIRTTTLFFHPKIYKKEKFIIIVQTMIGALALEKCQIGFIVSLILK